MSDSGTEFSDDKKGKAEKGNTFGSRDMGISDIFRNSYRTHVELSSIADNKSNIMISINGIIISVLIATILPSLDSYPWLLWPAGTLSVSCLVSLIYAVLAARPRVNRNPVTLQDIRSNRSNLLFFGNYNHLTDTEFVEGIEELMQDERKIYSSMARDLYGLGKVLFRKYELLRLSYTIFMIGITIAVILAPLSYLFH